jgi:glyoxylase-like metal-dependent hydrolase (beta-lactamase superfamily II)
MPDQTSFVSVRMYRGILGDCFLLTVVRDGLRKHTLIDCGVLQSVISGPDMVDPKSDRRLPDAVLDAVGRDALRKVVSTKEQIRRVAADVAKTVKDAGGKIDLLVMTHEHYDHLSGFALAWDVWADASLKIDKLWLAWTENPVDTQARQLKERFGKGKQALAYAGALAKAHAFAADDPINDALGLLDFIGPVDAPGFPLDSADPDNSKAPRTMAQVIDRMKDMVGAAGTRFLEPGQILSEDDGAGLKAYVLGPPRAIERLENALPGGAKEKKVIYMTEGDAADAVASAARTKLAERGFFAADRATAANVAVHVTERQLSADALPFARPHENPYSFGKKHKASDHPSHRDQLIQSYEAPDQEKRRIDGDWTSSAGALALKMDSDTNNTSLVLAFELPDQRVLLFPGDAQVGNWESWGDQPYPAPKFRKETEAAAQSIDDILRRVVFYKVGHHASHNATLRTRGLELMTDPRLCAAIPVVEAVAAVQGPGKKTPGKGWKMPYGDLYAELKKRTADRIVRGDGDPAAERRAFAANPAGVTVAYESEDSGGLWVELRFALEDLP